MDFSPRCFLPSVHSVLGCQVDLDEVLILSLPSQNSLVPHCLANEVPR